MSSRQAHLIDFEWAKKGDKLHDVSRFINSVTRERSDVDPAGYANELKEKYLDSFNSLAPEYQMAQLEDSRTVEASLYHSLINDELYKIGEHIAFAKLHPAVQEQKQEEAVQPLQLKSQMQ